MKKEINILFAATPNYIKYASVTMMSILEKTNSDIIIHFHFLYADIVNPISDKERNNWFEAVKFMLNDFNADITFYDVKDKMFLLNGQNTGMWGKEISLTHYIYLLAPLVVNKDKVIYLDTDMIVNTDLSATYDINIDKYLLAIASPSGKEIYSDMSNSGFLILNLALWRKRKTLDSLLTFGESLEKSNFCDQNLLYHYFTKMHTDDIFLLEKSYNVFPEPDENLQLIDIKILHFTGYGPIKPWHDHKIQERFISLWWKYARTTPFYENFLCDLIDFVNKTHKNKENLFYSRKKNIKIYKFFGFPLLQIKKDNIDLNKRTINFLGIRINYRKTNE